MACYHAAKIDMFLHSNFDCQLSKIDQEEIPFDFLVDFLFYSLYHTMQSRGSGVKREESAYKKIPIITDSTDAEGNDRMKEQIQENYNRIKSEVKQIVAEELKRIADDPELAHLIQQK